MAKVFYKQQHIILTATSLARAITYDPATTQHFFGHLQNLHEKFHFPANEADDVDDIGAHTVHQSHNIVDKKEKSKSLKIPLRKEKNWRSRCVSKRSRQYDSPHAYILKKAFKRVVFERWAAKHHSSYQRFKMDQQNCRQIT